MAPRAPRPAPTTLRGATIVAAPMGLVGVIGIVVALVSVLWIASGDHATTAASWATLVVSTVIGIAGFAAARGCRVVVANGVMRDVVAWRTVHRVPCSQIAAVRVRRGMWRVFEMELDDGTQRVVLGAGPVQFPANRMPDARDRDLADIDTMLGEDI